MPDRELLEKIEEELKPDNPERDPTDGWQPSDEEHETSIGDWYDN